MKIGPTQSITDACFPKKEIDVSDRKGNELSIGDKVRIYGCRADYGYIGYSGSKVVVYVEADGTSAPLWIDDGVRRRIELCPN